MIHFNISVAVNVAVKTENVFRSRHFSITLVGTRVKLNITSKMLTSTNYLILAPCFFRILQVEAKGNILPKCFLHPYAMIWQEALF